AHAHPQRTREPPAAAARCDDRAALLAHPASRDQRGIGLTGPVLRAPAPARRIRPGWLRGPLAARGAGPAGARASRRRGRRGHQTVLAVPVDLRAGEHDWPVGDDHRAGRPGRFSRRGPLAGPRARAPGLAHRLRRGAPRGAPRRARLRVLCSTDAAHRHVTREATMRGHWLLLLSGLLAGPPAVALTHDDGVIRLSVEEATAGSEPEIRGERSEERRVGKGGSDSL